MTTPRDEDVRWACAALMDWKTECVTDLFTIEAQVDALLALVKHILTEYGKGTDHPSYRKARP